MDTKRLILFVIFSFSILMLWDAWQRQHTPEVPISEAQRIEDSSIPQATKDAIANTKTELPQESSFKLQNGQRIEAETDLFKADIDTMGGDLRRLELIKHRAADATGKNFVLLDDNASPMLYVAQTGLIGNGLPTHKATFTSAANTYKLQEGADELEVRLAWVSDNGIKIDKIYTFHRGQYVVDVVYQIHNGSTEAITPSVYYQIVHDSESNQGTRMVPSFTGGAYFTNADKYKKLSFKDMGKANLSKSSTDGWVGLVQHYFVSAWIPKNGLQRELYTKQLSDNVYSIGSVSALGSIAPGVTLNVSAKLYTGPQTHTDLKAAAPGLEYTVDYGWLTIIATPLFWVLSAIQKIVHNWGAAIILLTVLIKVAFYPLSAASYRSMAHMREMAPRLQSLKEKFGDDRQKMQQAMMDLYKTEKINPMGGCLPILVQIPVFIALYWVLLGSVEMRHAPFILWIHDLSAKDPYYVLPTLMGLTMLIQTRLNPTPPDPIQAKVMQIMPIVFSVFFFFFPAGLVLYWLVNNMLSILQQWYINRTIGLASAAKKKGHARH
jgi:YidC/Oxa1 family membrane protein insertase